MSRFENRVPPPLLWVASAVLTWVIDRIDLDGSPFESPVADVIGILLAFAGLGCGVAGLVAFSRAGTTSDPHNIDEASSLVVGGIYRFTRNPMYLGMTLITAGWALRLGTVIGLVVGPLFLMAALTMLQIRPEERALTAGFGADYERYRSSVRRWI